MLPLKTGRDAVLVGFLLVTWMADALMTSRGYTLLEPYRNEKRSGRVLAYLSRPVTEDVLIIGSSRVEGGFDAVLLNERLAEKLVEPVAVYKLGIAGLRSIFLAELMQDAVANRPPKDLLVLAIEPRFFFKTVRERRGPRPGVADLATTGDDDETPIVRGEWEGESLADGLGNRLRGLEALWNLPWALSAERREASLFIQERWGEHETIEARIEKDRKAIAARRGRADLFDLPPGMMFEWPADDRDEMTAFRQVLSVCDALPCETVFVRMPVMPGFDETDEMREVTRRAFVDDFLVPRLTEQGRREARR